MTTPKPEKAWAVFDDNGKFIVAHINKSEAILMSKPYMTLWNTLYNRGYRCQRVVITPVKKG